MVKGESYFISSEKSGRYYEYQRFILPLGDEPVQGGTHNWKIKQILPQKKAEIDR
jgi:hypothetical protein